MARIMTFKRPKNAKKTLRRLLRYLGRHKGAMAAVALLVLLSCAANILGTYLIKPVINRYIVPGDMAGLLRILAGMGVMYAGGVLATLGYSQLMVRTGQKVVDEIRRDLFAHMQTLPLSYFDARTHGELMSHFTNDMDTVSEALMNSVTQLIHSFLMLAGTLGMLLVLNIRLSLIVVAFLGVMLLLIRFNGRRGKKYYMEQQKHLASVNSFAEEMISGQKVEKVFHHEAQDFAEFCRRNEALRQASTKAMSYSGSMGPTIVSLSYFNYAVSACVGGLFALAGLTDLGSLAAYLIYVRQSAQPLNHFTQQTNAILSALSGAERIFDMMDAPPEVDLGDVTLCRVRKAPDGSLHPCDGEGGIHSWKRPLPEGGWDLIPLRGDVRFHEVVFGYTPSQTVLHGISLFAKPGQKLAFVGSTGAGKTTVINLINRFYEIQSGAITYDGIDIRDIRKDDLRRSLSVVVQDTHLFTGTIADNIRYGRLDATDRDIRNAAKLANADSFIRRLPEGYDTMVEHDGENLSQGQRQLLSIARAAVSRPPVLILDEATSSIDTRTEALIEEGMDSLMAGRTVFVIAHRLSTVRNSQAILVLEQGQVMERGSHEELLTQTGRYQQLYTGQFELS